MHNPCVWLTWPHRLLTISASSPIVRDSAQPHRGSRRGLFLALSLCLSVCPSSECVLHSAADGFNSEV